MAQSKERKRERKARKAADLAKQKEQAMVELQQESDSKEVVESDSKALSGAAELPQGDKKKEKYDGEILRLTQAYIKEKRQLNTRIKDWKSW